MPAQRLAKITAIVLLAAFAGGGVFPSKEAPAAPDDLIKRWADGPVRYLMTYTEDERVKKLKSVPDLSQYISNFWARRDPTPGTLENEFRRTYWERVLEANKRFRDSTIPGWKTDRGKIYIMLGEPDDVTTDEDPSFSAGGSRGSTSVGQTGHQRGLQRWTYHRTRSRTADTEFIVAFVKDESLDWKLSTDASLIEPTFPGSVTTSSTDASFGGMEARPSDIAEAAQGSAPPQAIQSPQEAVEAAFPTINTSLFANYDLGLETAVPTATEEVITTVTAKEFLSAFPAGARFEFYRAADGATFVNVGAVIKGSDLYPQGATGTSSLRLYASLAPVRAAGPTRYASNDKRPETVETAKGPAPGGIYDVWTGLALSPGTYRATLGIEDSLTGRIGRTAADLDVPDFSKPGLRLSTLVLASDISDTAGRLGVTARTSGTFTKSESLGIYYEVYGLPGGDAAKFQSAYRFYREMPDGAAPSPIGKPIVFDDRTGAVQGWSFPLAKWPPGRYRMDVTVTGADSVSSTSQVAFEVVE